MAHIFGLEHSLGGIAGQIFNNPFGWGGVPDAVGFGFGPTGGTWTGNGAANDETGANIGDPSAVTTTGMNCGPSGTELREVVVNKLTGQIICMRKKKTRHRRRRLATDSDIADLSALKTVLSPAQMNNWIATRRRR